MFRFPPVIVVTFCVLTFRVKIVDYKVVTIMVNDALCVTSCYISSMLHIASVVTFCVAIVLFCLLKLFC